MKLKLLPKLGGIFLSTDVFLVQSLRQFRRYEVRTKTTKKKLYKEFFKEKVLSRQQFPGPSLGRPILPQLKYAPEKK